MLPPGHARMAAGWQDIAGEENTHGAPWRSRRGNRSAAAKAQPDIEVLDPAEGAVAAVDGDDDASDEFRLGGQQEEESAG